MHTLYAISLLSSLIIYFIIYLTETWINDGKFSNSFASSLLSPNYSFSQFYGRLRPIHSGGLVIISHKCIHHTSISMPIYSTFEYIGSSVSLSTFSVKFLKCNDLHHYQFLLSALSLNRYFNIILLQM